MFLKIALLSEGFAAVINRTLEGAFMRVRSQVIEEISPFFHSHIAIFEFAYEMGKPSFVLLSENLNPQECSKFGYKSLSGELIVSKISPVNHCNFNRFRDLQSFPDLFEIFDLFLLSLLFINGFIHCRKICNDLFLLLLYKDY